MCSRTAAHIYRFHIHHQLLTGIIVWKGCVRDINTDPQYGTTLEKFGRVADLGTIKIGWVKISETGEHSSSDQLRGKVPDLVIHARIVIIEMVDKAFKIRP